MSERILIVEDEPIIADDIERVLSIHNYEVAGKAYSSTKAIDMLNSRYPDLVLLDIALKGDKDGIDIAHIIRNTYKIPFIYLTSFSDKLTLERAKPTMPYGYIVKPFKDKDLLTTIEIAIYRYTAEKNMHILLKDKVDSLMDQQLTNMEFKIVELIWHGKSNKEIGDELFISLNTVKTHIKNIFIKMEVKSRNELIVRLR